MEEQLQSHTYNIGLGVSHETKNSFSFFLPSVFGCTEDQVQGEQVLGTRLLEASVTLVAGELVKQVSR